MTHTLTKPAPALVEEDTSDCIHHLFEAQAERTPQLAAVIVDGDTLTYADLNRRANDLARRLRSLGVGPDSLVGVCLDRTPEMIVALLGVLKAGGAYVPLDPDYPAERLAFMVKDAQACALLTSAGLQARRPDFGGPVLFVEDDAGEGSSNLPDEAGPDNLAYVIYTSGSTGTPKGVEICHRGVANNFAWRQATFPLAPTDKLLQAYSFSFDPSVWATFWPLTVGAAVVLPAPGEHGDPAALVRTLQEQRISVFGSGPSLLSALLAKHGIERCPHLRHVFCGGDTLTMDLARRFHGLLPHADLHNVYGPTEATIDAAWWTSRRDEVGDALPIGHPLPNTRDYVLDPDGALVSPGAAGELHIAGVGLARGYRQRPEITAARFVPNPFDTGGFPTLYRTGDLVRQRHDGALEFGGRLDHQVKVRGFRIELGEVEAALLRHSQVREAVVITREDRTGDRRLVAYVVADKQLPSRAGLRESVGIGLPAHMVPSAIVFLDALPLSPNGKLDRLSLPAPGPSDWDRDGECAPARTPLEAQLVAMFEDLLDVCPLGIRDDFFECGGHSLLAAQLVDRIVRETGRHLPLSALADAATVERLAQRLTGRMDVAPLHPRLKRWTDGPGRPFFFHHGSFIGGLWCGDLAQQLGTDRPFYTFAPHGSDGGPIPTTVEAMAAEYVAAMRAIQPAGPYLLGGFCNGGLVAYEMARQLRAAGQPVELLALVEIILPPTLVKLRLHGAAMRLGRPLGTRLSHLLQSASVPALLSLGALRRGWKRLSRTLRPIQGVDWSAVVPEPYRRTAVVYHLRPYDGPLTLIDAAQSGGRARAQVADGWQALAPQASVADIPGGHFDSLDENLTRFAERLRACLDGH